MLAEYVLLAFFFLCFTLLSALSRSVGALSAEELDLIENKHGHKMLARQLRNSKGTEAAFGMGKYLSLFVLALTVFQLVNELDAGKEWEIVFALSLGACVFLVFLSFLISRLLVASSHKLIVVKYSVAVLFLNLIFLPFSYLYAFVDSLFKKQTSLQHPVISMDDLSRALDLTEHSQTNTQEHRLLKGIVTFGNMDITRIMKPKMDIVAFDFHMGFRELIKKILESGYSRVPICREHLDQIVGVLYIKDLLGHLEEGDDYNWQALLRPCFFIPENIKPDELLREFQQKKKTHLAIVVDEFGQTAGLVTLEDIIEEIVGEISDEFDDDEVVYSKLDDNNYIMEGKTSMNDFWRITGHNAEEFPSLQTDADTLSGFIIERSGRFPKKNEKVNWENFTFAIEAADSRRIKRVKVTFRKKNNPHEK